MFKKILIVEDIDSVGIGLKALLQKNMPEADIRFTKFCDEALMKVKRSVAEEAPFDIVITDLSFPSEYTLNTIHNGEELIALVRMVIPHIKILVYSICDNPQRIYNLFYTAGINGLIQKGNSSLTEFETVLQLLYTTDATYITPALMPYIESRPCNQISEFDLVLLRYLADGYTQKDIIDGIHTTYPHAGLSTVEKHISHLKALLKANNTIHLVAMAKDLGII